MNNKTNVCGILAVCFGWIVPIVGLVLGIISLARIEPNKTLGIVGIIESLVFWVIWVGFSIATSNQ